MLNNIKKDIVVLENVYNKETYNQLFLELVKHRFTYFWGSGDRTSYWHCQLIEPSPVKDLCEELLLEFSNKFPNMKKPFTTYVNAQTYGDEPAPHYDYYDENSVTVVNYIAHTWNITWGGETFLFDQYAHSEEDRTIETIQSLLFKPIPIDAVITPAYNRSILFPGNKLHCVRALSRFFPGVRYTYMYKIRDITINQLMENYNAH